MRIKDIKTGVLTTFLVLSIAVPAFAKGMDHHGRNCDWGKKPRVMKMLDKLNLSDSQEAQVQDIVKQFRGDMKSQKRGLRDARRNLRELMFAEKNTETAIRQAFRETSSLKEELMVSRIRMMAEIKKVLTPEQLQSLKEIKSKRLQKFREKFESRKSG